MIFKLFQTYSGIRKYGTHSIHFRNQVLILVLTLVPVTILGVLLINIAIKNINKEISDTNLNLLKNIRENVDSKLLVLESLAYLFSSNVDLTYLSGLDSISLNEINTFEKYFSLKGSFAYVSTFYKQKNKLAFILMKSGTAIDSEGYVIRDEEYDFRRFVNEYFKATNGRSQWMLSIGALVLPWESKFVLVERVPLNSTNPVYMLVGMDNASMSSLTGFANESGNEFLIADANGIVNFSTMEPVNGAVLNRSILEKLSGEKGSFRDDDIRGEKVATYVQSSRLGWWFISLVSTDHIYSDINKVRNIYILLVLVVIFLGAILSVIITHKVAEPIQMLLSLIQNRDNPGIGNLETKFKFEEVNLISSSMVSSIKENLELKKGLEERLKMLRSAQIRALQSQINPHFLYNTLESISWSARKRLGIENETSELITALSVFLRFSLDDEDHLVFIADEIEYLKNYIYIQKYRYNNSFDVEWEIPAWMEQCKIIRISLQPILENSITHGLSEIKKGGMIKVSGTKSGEDIEITVSDNGSGMDDGQLERVNRMLLEDTGVGNDCIGLRNVNMRYRIFFGDAYGLHVESSPGNGTKVSIRFPALQL